MLPIAIDRRLPRVPERTRTERRRAVSRSDAASLQVGGLTRLTTIDYPGELAAVVFCRGCPWRCRYCHNGGLLEPDQGTRIPWTEIEGFLTRRVGLLDAVVFSGGEPTAQRALPAAISAVRSLGFKIGLHTSGAYPERLRRLLPQLDWVGLDIKAPRPEYEGVTGVEGSGKPAWESLDILLEAGLPMEVRTTLLPGWKPEQVAELARALADAGVRNYCLQRCDRQHALDPSLPGEDRPLAELAEAVESSRFARFTLRGHRS